MSEAGPPTCPSCDVALLQRDLHGVAVLHCEMCKQDFAPIDLDWMQPSSNPIINPTLSGEMAERVRHIAAGLLEVMVEQWNANQQYGFGEAGEAVLQVVIKPVDLTKVLYWLAQAGYVEIAVKHVAIPLNREQKRKLLASGKRIPDADVVLVKNFEPGWALKQQLPGMLPELPVLRAAGAMLPPEVGDA